MRRSILLGKPLYIYILLIFIMVASVALAVGYIVPNERLKGEYVSINHKLLNQIRENTDYLLRALDKELIVFAQDSDTRKFMENSFPDANERVLIANRLQNRLQSVKNANDTIQSVYFYSEAEGHILSDSGYMHLFEFYDPWIADQIHSNRDMFFVSGARRVDVSQDIQNSKNIISIVRKYPITAHDSKVRGAIVINIDEVSLNKLIANRENSHLVNIFITDSVGIGLSSENKSNIYHDFSDQAYMREILNGVDEGYVNDGNSFAFFSTSPYTGWRYISVIPTSAMNKLYSSASKFMFWLVMVVLLFAGGALSLILKFLLAPKEQFMSHMAKMIYRVEGKTFNENLSLHEFQAVFGDFMNGYARTKSDIKDYLPMVKWRVINNLLMGYAFDYEAELRRLSYLGVDLRGAAFLVLNIEFFSDAPKKVYQALPKLCDELENIINQDNKGVVVTQNENTISVILCFADFDKDKNTMTALGIADMLRNHISDKINSGIAIGLGNVYVDFSHICTSNLEASEAIKYRILMGKNPIISIEDIEPPDDKRFVQILAEESAVVGHMVSCDFAKCVEQLDMMFESVRLANVKPDMVYQTCIHLIVQCVHKLEIMGIDVYDVVQSLNVYEILNTFKDVDGIRNFLCTVLRDFIAQIEKTQTAKTSYSANSNLITKIQEYMKENYAVSDMSLNLIASEFHLSAPYLSKLFKEFVGMNFIDYLIYIRMESAKNLLLNTNLKATEIAARVGYSSFPSFIKIFKKFTGKTPGEFRKS